MPETLLLSLEESRTMPNPLLSVAVLPVTVLPLDSMRQMPSLLLPAVLPVMMLSLEDQMPMPLRSFPVAVLPDTLLLLADQRSMPS